MTDLTTKFNNIASKDELKIALGDLMFSLVKQPGEYVINTPLGDLDVLVKVESSYSKTQNGKFLSGPKFLPAHRDALGRSNYTHYVRHDVTVHIFFGSEEFNTARSWFLVKNHKLSDASLCLGMSLDWISCAEYFVFDEPPVNEIERKNLENFLLDIAFQAADQQEQFISDLNAVFGAA